jgi:uncharacterized phage protein gp47/JayE
MPDPTWGTSADGHFRPRFAEIREANAERYKELFGGNRPTTDDTIDGHFISLISEIESDIREADEATYGSQYVDTAAGVTLDATLALIAKRKLGVASTVVISLGDTDSTVIPAGSIVEEDVTKVRYTLDAEVTITGGSTDGNFTAVEDGPNAAAPGSTWNIITPVSGWNTNTNAAAAVAGQNEETDAEYRVRAKQIVKKGGIAAAVLKVDGVLSVHVVENDTDFTTSDGVPPHSVEVIVDGGADTDVAQAIYDNKCDGIRAFGTTSANVTDVNGDTRSVSFTRPTLIVIHTEITITPGEGFPASDPTASLQQAIEDWGAANLSAGDDVSPFQMAEPINEAVPGIDTAVTLVEDIDPPTSGTTFAISIREKATIAFADVDVIIL